MHTHSGNMDIYYISSFTLFLVITILKWKPTLAHPQCLDFRPPFELEDKSSVFCSDYASFGCCSRERNVQIHRAFTNISLEILKNGIAGCTSYLKEILCQECSPYAAHIFDAETTRLKRPLLGMCNEYCIDFYDSCRDVVKYVTNDSTVLQTINDRELFCRNNAITDPEYCYPDILVNTDLNKDIDRETRTEEGCLCLEPFARDLRNPLIFRAPDDQSGRIIVGTQIGVVYVYYSNGTRLSTPFMDLTNVVLTSSNAGDERGLLGLAFHPDFKNNQKFYVYFTLRSSTGSRQKARISEFHTMSSDPNRADRNSERKILEVDQPYSNHNGGELMFGIDGYLYSFLGDGGAGGDPKNSGQNKGTLLGSVLRLDINSQSTSLPYAIPPDNPFVNEVESRPEIYAYGIRNIWRCDVDDGDPETGYGRGRIICGDVGQSAYEEIDIIKKGGNYGWNAREGFECYRDDKCGNIGPEELPIHAYGHNVGNSVTGGHVYRGCLNPNLNGFYIYGDYGRGRIFRLKETAENTNKWENKEVLMCGDEVCFNGLVNRYERNILSFGEDYNGEIYVLTTDWASPTAYNGKIYKVVDPRMRGDVSTCRSSKWESSSVSTPTTTTTTTTTTTSTPTTTTSTTTTSTTIKSTTTTTTAKSTTPFKLPSSTPTAQTTFRKSTVTTGDDQTMMTCADIAFIIDGSGSVGEYRFLSVLGFIISQVNQLDIGPDAFQVGVITFGNKATINIPLNKSHDQRMLRELIENVKYKDENTNTSGALREMRTRLFTHKYGARQGYRKIGILLTDGQSTYDKQKTIPEAQELHRENIEMYVITFGKHTGLDPKEIEAIASQPTNEHVTHYETFPFQFARQDIKLPWTQSSSRHKCTIAPGSSPSSTTQTPISSTVSSTHRPSTTSMRTSTKNKSTPQYTSKLTTLLVSTTTTNVDTATKEPHWSCDFDKSPPSDPWCGMQQSLQDQFNWTLTNRATPSDPTGPDTAQNGQYYIYIETSNPKKPNDKAVLYFPPLSIEGPFCLTFYVHMYGFHIREIQLLVEDENRNTDIKWQHKGEVGNFWFEEQVALQDLKLYQRMAFLGIKGDEYSGDIGLDNIKLYNTPCSSSTT